ncbi:hypothetical protein GPECTOR_3g58 [Gonium pectorale]|uniref:Uncharacterized protein n=1 Tax=Gonium pectorale TaxID=33097 RepID=A0A150GZR4_GONPE|nr:hypothetical protein GPECTOR_3g58 [Gonium pectorale]|eukprot:KXZ55406.1 hypothetical protein GPECTOR_3g58 [Gonium pectorale]
MRKARVEVRRVDAIQLLMAAARSRNNQPAPQSHQQTAADGAAAATAQPAAAGAPVVATATTAVPTTAAAPCTHCGTVLPVSAGSLRQCCGCLDVFCSLCSVLDYEEREDRVFCLSCLEDQTAASRGNRDGMPTTPGAGGRGAATGGLSLTLSLPRGGAAGRWGALDGLGRGDATTLSPFPCSRTPMPGQAGSRTPGSALYSSRSHRGFSALLAYGGVGGS